jgi:hypothetical protein
MHMPEWANELPSTGKDDPTGHGLFEGRATYQAACMCGAGNSRFVDDGQICEAQSNELHELYGRELGLGFGMDGVPNMTGIPDISAMMKMMVPQSRTTRLVNLIMGMPMPLGYKMMAIKMMVPGVEIAVIDIQMIQVQPVENLSNWIINQIGDEPIVDEYWNPDTDDDEIDDWSPNSEDDDDESNSD